MLDSGAMTHADEFEKSQIHTTQDRVRFYRDEGMHGQGDLVVSHNPKTGGDVTADSAGDEGLHHVPKEAKPYQCSVEEELEKPDQLVDSLSTAFAGMDPKVDSPTGPALKKACFYDLPQTVRERIYWEVLVIGRVFINCYVTSEARNDAELVSQYEPPNLALLATSKQIYAEACPIFFGENLFVLFHADYLAAQLVLHPAKQASFLRVKQLEICFDYRDYPFFTVRVPIILALMAQKLPQDCPEREPLLARIQHMRTKLQGTDLVEGTIVTMDKGSDLNLITSDNIAMFAHARHLSNMEMYIWGRVMDVLRRYSKLDVLAVDVRRCQCPQTCCRLADRVLEFGSLRQWLHGAPVHFECRGAGKKESRAINESLRAQRDATRIWQHNVMLVNAAVLSARSSPLSKGVQESKTDKTEVYEHTPTFLGDQDPITIVKEIQKVNVYNPYRDLSAPLMHMYLGIARAIPDRRFQKPREEEIAACIAEESKAALKKLRAMERRERRQRRRVCPDGHIGCAYTHAGRHSNK